MNGNQRRMNGAAILAWAGDAHDAPTETHRPATTLLAGFFFIPLSDLKMISPFFFFSFLTTCADVRRAACSARARNPGKN